MRDQDRPTAAELTALLDAQTGQASREQLLDRALSVPASALELRLLLALERDAQALAQEAARPVRNRLSWRFALPAGALAVAALLFTGAPRRDAVPEEALLAELEGSVQMAQVEGRSDRLLDGSFEAADRFSGGFE